MALQDLEPLDPNSLIDPKTGKPYAYMSPEWQAAVGPYLSKQLQNQAERAANARGMFYSGPAMADEIQAAGELTGNMEQQGAQLSQQQQQLLEEQQFDAEQRREEQQANADLASKQAAAGAKAAAIQGGLGSLGTIGGLAAAHHFGWLGGGGSAASSEAAAIPQYNALVASGEDPVAAAHAAEYISGGSASPSVGAASNGASLAEAGQGSAQLAGAAPVDATAYGDWEAPLPEAPHIGSTTTGLASLTEPGSFTLGGAVAGAGAGYGGNRLGDKLYGNHGWKSDTGSAIGGGIGFVGGSMVGGPVGGAAGAGLGSLMGHEALVHPQNVALAPFTAGLSMVPGIGGWADRNLNPAHWF